eukprot:357023-Chlamydomonas_euryale.AAC.5
MDPPPDGPDPAIKRHSSMANEEPSRRAKSSSAEFDAACSGHSEKCLLLISTNVKTVQPTRAPKIQGGFEVPDTGSHVLGDQSASTIEGTGSWT